MPVSLRVPGLVLLQQCRYRTVQILLLILIVLTCLLVYLLGKQECTSTTTYSMLMTALQQQYCTWCAYLRTSRRIYTTYRVLYLGVVAVRLQKKLRFDFGIRNDVTFRRDGFLFFRARSTVDRRRSADCFRSDLQSSICYIWCSETHRRITPRSYRSSSTGSLVSTGTDRRGV